MERVGVGTVLKRMWLGIGATTSRNLLQSELWREGTKKSRKVFFNMYLLMEEKSMVSLFRSVWWSLNATDYLRWKQSYGKRLVLILSPLRNNWYFMLISNERVILALLQAVRLIKPKYPWTFNLKGITSLLKQLRTLANSLSLNMYNKHVVQLLTLLPIFDLRLNFT